MRRIIIKIHASLNGPAQFYHDESPFTIDNFDVLHAFTFDLSTSPFSDLNNGLLTPGLIRTVGETLFDLLAKHEAVAQAIDSALLACDTLCPIYVQVQADSVVELVPWETLCHVGRGFLALSDTWPVARITSAGTVGDSSAVPFVPPLRMMALLSAAGMGPTLQGGPGGSTPDQVACARRRGRAVPHHAGTDCGAPPASEG